MHSLWEEVIRRLGELLLFAFFGQFKNEGPSNQVLKSLFLSNLFMWVSSYIDVGSMSLIDFVDQLGSH